MGDVKCSVCGEPWEYYAVQHEFSEAERKKLLNGKGCPCCKGEVPEHRENMTDAERRLERLTSIDTATDLDPIAFF